MYYFREKEEERLKTFCEQTETKAMAIYGRRRTGKTRLITEFIKKTSGEYRFLYCQCISYDYKTCLADFLNIARTIVPDDQILMQVTTFRDAIRYIAEHVNGPLCFVIDEFPFLAKRREDVIAEFQWIIDHGLFGKKLILLGSNRSFMKHQIQESESPLYGRFDALLEIRPFSFEEVRTLFPNLEDAMHVYAETGGVAQYVMFFLSYPSVEEASADLFFTSDGRLNQEAPNLLMQELRDVTTYERILRALGTGEKNAGQIAAKSGLDSKGISVYINRLMELEMISIVSNPLTQEKRNLRYRISDQLIRFHYAFIEPNMSLINALQTASVPYILGEHYQEYLGFVYEDIIRGNCFQYALSGLIPFMPTQTGKWWGQVKLGEEWKESEIDLVACDEQHIVIGECKYRTKQMGIKELVQLEAKAASVPTKNREVYYLLASKSGFMDELKNVPDHVILVSPI